MKSRTKCALFDLDGTLVDSAPDLGLAANLVREELGMEPLPIEVYRPQASSGARGLLGVALDITPQHPDFEQRKTRFLELYRANLSKNSVLFDGIADMLAGLDQAGIRWGIVTNKAGWLAEPVVADLGLAKGSAVLVSGDATKHPKPAPDNLLLAAQEIGLDPADCVYVGDDLRDIVAGRAAGMPTVAAAWGYLGTTPDVSTWNADYTVETPLELVSLLVAA